MFAQVRMRQQQLFGFSRKNSLAFGRCPQIQSKYAEKLKDQENSRSKKLKIRCSIQYNDK